jgi:hypothetical protein
MYTNKYPQVRRMAANQIVLYFPWLSDWAKQLELNKKIYAELLKNYFGLEKDTTTIVWLDQQGKVQQNKVLLIRLYIKSGDDIQPALKVLSEISKEYKIPYINYVRNGTLVTEGIDLDD